MRKITCENWLTILNTGEATECSVYKVCAQFLLSPFSNQKCDTSQGMSESKDTGNYLGTF